MFKPGKKKYKNAEDVHVRSSYYTFSKEYPASVIQRTQKNKKSEKKSNFFRGFFALLLIIVFSSVGYFFTSFFISVSGRDIPEKSSYASEDTENLLEEGSLKAYTLPSDKIGNSKYIRSLIRKIKWNDASSVIIDFKDEDGNLLYSSNQLIAAGNARYDNDTIRKAIQMFTNKNISVIAGFYCFEDSFATEKNPDMAIKYPESEVNWLDGESGEEGKAWLNPYSDDALTYLENLVREISDFGVEGFILKSASFPVHGDIDSTYYIGEKKASTRASVLQSFVTEVKMITGSFVVVQTTVNQIMMDKDTCFYGSLDEIGDGVVVDFSQRPEGYVIDKETEYSSMLSLVSNVGAKLKNRYIVLFSLDESPRGFVKTVNNSGYSYYFISD